MTLIWVFLGLAAALFGLFILAWINAIAASVSRNRKLDKLIQPAIEAVAGGLPSGPDLVMQLASQPATRNRLFERLSEMKKSDLFPPKYREVEKVAESDLACWLMHRNELGAAPSEIEIIQDASIEEEKRVGKVFLFRFRADASHWAASKGWMAGLAGPYWDGEASPNFAPFTFSELTPFDELTSDQHLDTLLKSSKRPILVVRS